MFAIEKLRKMRDYFGWMNEGFNQQFTLTQLEKIYDCAIQHKDWDECADTWTYEQLQEALA